jgi:hypothetical protein
MIILQDVLDCMLWCLLSLAHDLDFRDDGVWQVAYDPYLCSLCSFKFAGGQYSLEDREVVIAWVTVPF